MSLQRQVSYTNHHHQFQRTPSVLIPPQPLLARLMVTLIILSQSALHTRTAFAVPIELEAISRPVSSENLPCSHLVSNKKLPLRMPNSAGLAFQHLSRSPYPTISALPGSKILTKSCITSTYNSNILKHSLIALSTLPLSYLSQLSSWPAFIDRNSEQIAWGWLQWISWPLKTYRFGRLYSDEHSKESL